MINQKEFLRSGAILGLPSGEILVGWGVPQYGSIPQAKELNFYAPDFFLNQIQPWICFSHWKECTVNELSTLLTFSELSPIHWQISYKNLFDQAFVQLQQNFQSGKLEKAVPYIFAESFQQMDKDRLQKSLLRGLQSFSEKAGYLYGYWHKDEGFIGITPEILFTHQLKQSQKLYTMALAGTCRSSDSIQEFQKNTKEYEEHSIVVEGIQQSLQTLGTVEIGLREVLKLPGLNHLMTPIYVQLNDSFQFETIVKQMHPTPALGAFPRLAGWQWLMNYNQQLERKSFGAPFGIYNPMTQLSFCIVGIRQIQWSSQGMRMGAGCGVVSKSILEKEWDEIQLKLQTVQYLLT